MSGRLPKQRRGVAPGGRGRYPDFDVLEQARHWDPVTRALVLDRVVNVPPYRFFAPAEITTLGAFCDTVMSQHEEPRIPVLAYVDEKLHLGELDGFQYADMPDDRETWRLVARRLDEEAARRGARSFADLSDPARGEVVHRFSRGELEWEALNVEHAWEVVMRSILVCFYSHPWSWNEIGFGGPAYPRGYAAFGSPGLGQEAEHWEAREEFELDPVEHTRERGLD